MRQSDFERTHKRLWDRCQDLLEGNGLAEPAELPSLHRRLCLSLALARSRGYSPNLVERLHVLARSTHALLHGTRPAPPATIGEWIAGRFPARVREESTPMLIALLAFWGPALATGFVLAWHPQWRSRFLSPEQVADLLRMYSPEVARLGRKGTENDFLMFGFYVWNNVSILFRTFASGVALGIPSLLSLAQNGVQGGASAAVLSADESTRPVFWTFVATHSAFEVTGLVLSGGAGLRLGWSVLSPGRLGRLDSFRLCAARMAPVVACSAGMLVLAALLEAFWSANPAIPAPVRLSVGILAWVGTASYLLLAGRRRAA